MRDLSVRIVCSCCAKNKKLPPTSATKLAPMHVATFEKIGLGQWFRYLTGTVEVIGAILIMIQPGGELFCDMTLRLKKDSN